jgi:hypothetical protein
MRPVDPMEVACQCRMSTSGGSTMDAAVEQLQTLLDLEARHDELLDRLAELDQRVAGVLSRCQASIPADQATPSDGGDQAGVVTNSTLRGSTEAG